MFDGRRFHFGMERDQAAVSCQSSHSTTINNFSIFFNNVSSSYGRIKLHTKKQPLSVFSSGNSYEEVLTIRIWKMTSQFCSQCFF